MEIVGPKVSSKIPLIYLSRMHVFPTLELPRRIVLIIGIWSVFGIWTCWTDDGIEFKSSDLQFSKAFGWIIRNEGWITMLFNASQSLNANCLIDLTDGGISISLSDEHFSKQLKSIVIKFDCVSKEMISNDEQLQKAPIKMIFTDFGISISFKEIQSLNAYSPIDVTKEEEGKMTFSNDEHPLNKLFSIEFKEEEIVIDFNDVQKEKVNLPILVIDFGNSTSINDLHL